MLPMSDPTAASDELTRCIKELNFVGALVPNHTNGRYYDDAYFWPVFGRAERLNVPIYLHPTSPPPGLEPHYEGNYAHSTANVLGSYGFGWHSETGLHVLRLFASGLFDKYPRLQIIIGHMGEMLP